MLYLTDLVIMYFFSVVLSFCHVMQAYVQRGMRIGVCKFIVSS